MTQTLELEIKALRALQDRLERQNLEPSDWQTLFVVIKDMTDRAEIRFANRLAKLLEKLAEQENRGEADDAQKGKPEDAPADHDTEANPNSPQPDPPNPQPIDKPRGSGHGRNGSSAFTNATHFYHVLLTGIIGSICAVCKVGTMQRYRDKTVIRIVGQPLFAAELHHCQQARCKICGKIAQAEIPTEVMEGIGSSYINYNWSACAMLAVMHYFAGLPFKRLESLHKGWGIPFADDNQWNAMNEADSLLLPLFRALEKYGIINGQTLRIDDTGSEVIEIQKSINREIKAHESVGKNIKDIRTGINATGVYIEADEEVIVLYYTGRHHAGEIFAQMLDQRRRAQSDSLIKVTDAASKNFGAAEDGLIEAVCNAHAMLNFRDIKDKYPDEYAVAGGVYKKVFDFDDIAKASNMTPMERLDFHKKNSLPLMKSLKEMCEDKLKSKLVDPRSALWKPLTFIINQWPRLVKFCENPGVPLDTNLVEQTLIIPVRYLAASFNYQTINGAEVGDRFMSLIVTALKNEAEPVSYLTYCLQNHVDLAKNPEKYLPWVCRDFIKHVETNPPKTG